jgi:hypothetical protein
MVIFWFKNWILKIPINPPRNAISSHRPIPRRLDQAASAQRIEYIDRIEASRLGIDYDLLLDAVSEGGGAIDINGRYPVTEEIKERLRKVGLRP